MILAAHLPSQPLFRHVAVIRKIVKYGNFDIILYTMGDHVEAHRFLVCGEFGQEVSFKIFLFLIFCSFSQVGQG